MNVRLLLRCTATILLLLSTNLLYAEEETTTTSETITTNKNIDIASYHSPPFSGKNLPHFGLNAHIITAAFEQLNYKVSIHFKPFKRAFISTQNGQHEAMFSAWHREDRLEYFAYSKPINYREMGFYALKNRKLKYSHINELAGLKVGIQRGSSIPEAILKSGLKTDEVSDLQQNIKKLLAGRIDIWHTSREGGITLIKKTYPQRSAEIEWIGTVTSSSQHLIFSKKINGYQEKLDDFNQGLEILQKNNMLQKIKTQHSASNY